MSKAERVHVVSDDRPPDASVLHARIEELKAEFATGERRLAELDVERTRVRDMMLRIEGAIVALEEMLGREEG